VLEARRKGVVGLGIFASWRKVPYGVSFAAAAISASSESEFRGVIRGGRVEEEEALLGAFAPDRFVAMSVAIVVWSDHGWRVVLKLSNSPFTVLLFHIDINMELGILCTSRPLSIFSEGASR
jgi:hypothetical protein